MKGIYYLFALMVICSGCNIYQKTGQTYVAKTASGEVKKVGSTQTKKATKSDQYSYYQRWDNELIDYHANGNVKSVIVCHYKVGTYGRPCKELLYKQIEFNEYGVKINERKDVCDCKTSTIKEYSDKGQLTSKKITKTKSNQ